MPPTLSVIVLTRNEKENIEACLRSAGDAADETVVVDSLSTDRTAEIAERLGARVLKNPFESYSRQRNWALEHVSSEWVFFLDADERLTPALREEIRRTLHESPAYDGYWVRRETFFRDRRVRCWSGDTMLRLFRRTRGRYGDKLVHEEVELRGKAGRLRAPLEHHTFRSFAQYLPKMHHFTALAAEDAFRRGRRTSWPGLALRPLGHFAKMYIVKRGFLDGVPGLLIAWLSAYSTYLKYAKLWERQTKARRDGGQ
jgi:glycosyltransferase involved in cell wall biosynthesis